MKRNIVLYCFLFLAGVVYLIFEFNTKGDFKVFLDAGQLIKQNENIYIYNELNHFKYYYSPLFALILSIFSGTSYLIPIILWKILNLFFLYRIWILIEKHFIDLSGCSDIQRNIFRICVLLSSFIFISKDLHLVQITIFILYTVIEGLHLILYKKQILYGSILIALSLNIKILPVVILPYLLYRREFLSGFYIICISFFLLIIPAFFIGFEYNTFLLTEWWKSINPFNQEHVIDINEKGFHSLSAVFSSLFTSDLGNEYNLQYRRNILDLNYRTIFYILNAVRLVLILYTVRILKLPPFRKSNSKVQTFYEISYILLITPLIFPHQQIFGFLLVLPAMFYIIYVTFKEVIHNRKLKFKNGLLIFSILIINSSVLFGFLKNLLYHYKIMTYGVILLLVLFLLYPLKLMFVEDKPEGI